jgi:hypothetical protein
VTGRVRCRQPIVTADGERLVALHRNVEVRLRGGAWQTVERLREHREFDLWDHAGQIPVDPEGCAEPLLAIPSVWRGAPDDLPPEYRGAVADLEAASGSKADAARAETRSVSVVDRLTVLARPVRGGDGSVVIAPPDGGYVISAVPHDAAMRLLGGTRRSLVAGVATVAIGVAILGVTTVVALADVLL